MKTAKSMQAIITAIAEKHGLDLSADSAHLRLENEPYMPLVVEKISRHLVSVAHYYYQNGDLIPDPDILFFICPKTGAWIPIEIQQTWGYQRVAELNDTGTGIKSISARGQADVVSFTNLWASNIKAQCWFEDGVKARKVNV